MEKQSAPNENTNDTTLPAFEVLYKNFAETSSDIIFVIDKENVIQYVNDSAARLFFKTAEAIIGESIEHLFNGKILERQKRYLDMVFTTGQPVHEIGLFEFKSGKIWLDTTLAPVISKAGIITAVMGVSRDITIQKNTEIELAREQELFSVILESIADGVIVTDVRGNVILLNKIAEHYTGWNSKEAQGKPIQEVVTLHSLRDTIPYINIVPLILREQKAVDLYNELVMTSVDGAKHFVSQIGSPLRDHEGTVVGAVVVLKDISEQLLAEEDLIRAERLESIGILAGGIGHDFNNILTGILGNITLMRKMITNPLELEDLIQQSEKAAIRAKDLTRQLLTFSKGGDPIKTASSIQELIFDTISFLLSGSSIDVEYSFSENLPAVDIDQAQIGQVIQNIVINAKQAMDDTGRLYVSAEKYLPDGTFTSLQLNETYVHITIRDTGKGMPKDMQKKVFDPFFTTKEEGSGLGLTICYSIIQKHRGTIKIQSIENEGTVVSFYLPVTNSPVEKKAANFKTSAAEGKRILIIDDEAIIRRTAESCLKSVGYVTASAVDGESGISMYKNALESDQSFDLVIIDLTIRGGMSGLEVIKELKTINPHVCSLVSSGYSDSSVMSDYKVHGFDGVLAKPYTMDNLIDIVHDVLS